METPLSMMSAFRRGRYSDAIAEANWKTSTPSSSQRYGLQVAEEEFSEHGVSEVVRDCDGDG